MRLSKSKPKPKASVSPLPRTHWSFDAIGTRWSIDIYDGLDPAVAGNLQTSVRRRIEQFDHDYSRFRNDSLVSAMARAAGTYSLPPDARPLFDLYRQFYGLTDGAMTPLIGRLLSDAGYDAQYSLRPGPLTPTPRWEDVIDYSFPRIRLSAPALLDVGAAGKGYLVDLIADLLGRGGVTSYCVDAGGDMAYRHAAGTLLDVGLEHPADPEQVVGVAHLASGSLCGSAGNRRAWGGYHHIISPHTQASPSHILAIWAMADSTMLADALTTALFFVPAPQLAQAHTFEYAIIYQDYSLEHSADFPATFFAPS